MNKSLAMRWVKALRSGKYKQGTGKLKSGTGDDVVYCCLGVLADIRGKEIKAGSDFLDRFDNYCGLKSREGIPLLLNGKDGNVFQRSSLAQANDQGISFKRIATWIEKNYKKL